MFKVSRPSGPARPFNRVATVTLMATALMLGDPANAQNVPGDHLPAITQRLAGVWETDNYNMSIYTRNGRIWAYLRTRLNRPGCERGCREYVFEGDVAVTQDGAALEGQWVDGSQRNRVGQWRLSMAGDRLQVEFLDGEPVSLDSSTMTRSAPHGQPSPPVFERFLGSWVIPYGGTMVFREEYKRLVAEYRLEDNTGVPRVRKVFLFHPENVTTTVEEGDTLVGAWQDVGVGRLQGGRAELTLLEQGSRFGGRLHEDPAHASWVGSRSGSASGAPASPASPPSPPVTPDLPRPTPTPPTAPANDGFLPLGAWEVRVDQVENPREDRLVHVYLTLRNASTRRLMQTEGISVLHEDSSGIAVESGQGLKAQPGYPELFGSPPPVVLPGREIRTKFVFDRNRGARTTQVTVQEGADHAAVFEF